MLFPALFNSIAKSKIDFILAAPALKTAVVVVIVGITLAWLAKPLFQPAENFFASGFQTAFRFNSYIGQAIAGQPHREAGIAAFGIII